LRPGGRETTAHKQELQKTGTRQQARQNIKAKLAIISRRAVTGKFRHELQGSTMSLHVHQQEHQKRVNRVVNYITHNYDRDLDLDTLASVAGFSPYHFHRMFKSVTGEAVFHFVRRLRVETAATLLLIHRDLPVGHIAVECGFNSQSVFARAFQEHFGRSASEWRQGGFWWHNGRRWEWRAHGGEHDESPTAPVQPNAGGPSIAMLAEAGNGRRFDCLGKIEMSSLPTFRIAYMRQLGPYDAEPILRLWERFTHWSEARGLLTRQSIGVALPQDNQNVVAPEHCRYDVGLVVDPEFPIGAEFDVQDIPGGKYLIAEFTGRLSDEPLATEYLWRHYLPSYGLQQDLGPVFRRFAHIDWKDEVLSHDSIFTYQICIRVTPRGYPLVKPEIIIEPFR
jgi:AraC family transcriptional regulator